MQNDCRKCRREGIKLFLKGEKCFLHKCPVTLRPYAPGQHGQTSFTKLSEFGKQLREKQKVKKVYGLSETQLKNYYLKAAKKTGDTSENIILFLESRLDSLVYRLNIAPSRSAARQLVSHRNFMIDGKNVDIASILVTPKNEVSIKNINKIKSDQKIQPPSWIDLNQKKGTFKLKHLLSKDELELPFDINLVIEYYSR